MRFSVRVLAALAVSMFLRVPSADAQGYVAPSLGVVFGNPSAEGQAVFAADLGWMSRFEPLGAELDVMYAPSFFGSEGSYGENSVTTVMANIIVAGGEGGGGGRYGRRGGGSGVRPYVSGGVGVIHEVVTTTDAANKIANSDLGLNIGVGVLAATSPSVGVRGDLRYFRDVVARSNGDTANIDFGAFHFWRVSVGVILSF